MLARSQPFRQRLDLSRICLSLLGDPHLERGKGADAIIEADISSSASTANDLASGELPPINKLSDSESFESECIFITVSLMNGS
ncbi:hypothetical protein NDA07_27795 [Microcoleus vaginatus DQ-U2]|uniref:hypothetical protein n=1 Tax=Microcoleus vaginatus TaxID=119532 RepID=UPI00168786DD|nr:hypothetical protein [Microcoleus sp. FACHB-DQ6]